MMSTIRLNDEQLKTLTIATTRAYLAASLGQTFDGKRDIYNSCGWERTLSFTNFFRRWDRDGIARRVVGAYSQAAWNTPPDVWDSDDEKKTTPFEKALNEVAGRTSLWQNLAKLDERCGIGRYGCLFLGVDDGLSFDQPLKKGKRKLLYVTPLYQDQAAIKTFETDVKNERFGLPTMYAVQFDEEAFTSMTGATAQLVSGMTTPGRATMQVKDVHWTRMVHIAPSEPPGTVYGYSRMHSSFNLLQDIEKLLGSCSEAFWKVAYPGLSIEAPSDVEFDSTDAELEDEIENYTHDLTRTMRLRGAVAKTLSPNAQDPRGTFEVQMDTLAAMTGIPKRILLGNEAGELASSQDITTWMNRVKAYRKNFSAPSVVQPVLKHLSEYGLLPEPAENKLGAVEATVEWPEKEQHTEVEKADIAVKRIGAINQYVSGGASQLIPPLNFLVDELGIDQDVAQGYLEEVARMQEEMAAEQAGAGYDMDGLDAMPEDDEELFGEASDAFGEDVAAEDVDAFASDAGDAGEAEDLEDEDEDEDEDKLKENAFDESKVKRDKGQFSSTGGQQGQQGDKPSPLNKGDRSAAAGDMTDTLKQVRTDALHASGKATDAKTAAAAYVLVGRAIKSIDRAEGEGRVDKMMARSIRSQLETRQKSLVSKFGKEAGGKEAGTDEGAAKE